MKNILLIFCLTISFLTHAQGLQFTTYKIEVNKESITAYSHTPGQIDSVQAIITAYFGISGNPYMLAKEDFTKRVAIKITIQGDAAMSSFETVGLQYANNYREEHFPDTD